MKLLHKIIYDKYEDKRMKSDPIREELWIKGILVLSGDWYHNKISEKIEGFILGVKHTSQSVEVDVIRELGEI